MAYLKYLGYIFLILLIASCSNDPCDKTCSGCIDLQQAFTMNVNCNVVFQSSNESLITINLMDIIDERTFGDACAQTNSGQANLLFEIDENGVKTEVTVFSEGCQNEQIPFFGSVDLPTIDIGLYDLKILKLYPLSTTIENNAPLANYDLLAVLLLK
jgi:hypothetical protein